MNDTITLPRKTVADALNAHQSLREWAKAVPQGTMLPTMPGCDGDWLDAVERRMKAALEAPQPIVTYSSTQATKCACCGEYKHTPLRVDFMGGYVCLTCIDKNLESLRDLFLYWMTKYDKLLEQQLATTPQAWTDENVIAWCIARGLMYAQPESQPVQSLPDRTVRPNIPDLLAEWERRSKDALPADAMLINKHIRELRETIEGAKP